MASKFCSMTNFSIVLLLSLLLSIADRCNGGVTSSYRRKLYALEDMPLDYFPSPPGYNAPEQVHITQGDYEGRAVIISWVNPKEKLPNHVTYWSADDGKARKRTKTAVTKTYKYYDYTSGYIHHAKIEHLKFDTKYFYEIGEGKIARQFSFATPPKPGADVPYTFGIIGDLGQTIFSNQTFEHYVANNKSKAVLNVGDLSYADDHKNHDNRRWDTWGRFVEKSTAYQPWIWTPGNHEIDVEPSIGETKPFKPYLNRYPVPYKAAGSTSPLWYSIKRGPAYIIVLSSYSATAKYTPQYRWLSNEWSKINRTETPWLIVLVHSPWYNSNNYHFMEGENMRVVFEQWFVDNKVDLVFAGHVHSYERSYRVSNTRYKITDGMTFPVKDPSAPVYFTVGDGGNLEGLANNFSKPQPCYSAYREASFGHAILDIKNRTHAYFIWHRNEDDKPVNADSSWFYNRYWYEYPEEGHEDCDCLD